MDLITIVFVLGIVIFAAGFQLLDRIIRRMSEKKKADRKHRKHRR